MKGEKIKFEDKENFNYFYFHLIFFSPNLCFQLEYFRMGVKAFGLPFSVHLLLKKAT